MASDRDVRAGEIFKAALERDAAERSAFVHQQCGNDAKLQFEVESLLRADDAAASEFLARSPIAGAASISSLEEVADRLVGRQVGRYQVRRLIAAGGMGAVYEAVQDHPQRIVALKVMRTGIASRSAMRRFEYESQILARLRHPGIAQVHDAGMHDDGTGGVPYFVMEFIPNARSLTEFARANALSTRQRLELFMHVCDAVHHGHQKGVIHRDLKPANILVDSMGLIKIIDFGVARATDSDLAVTTFQTDVGQLVGTLQYMSPEQVVANPHDLDVRSDVYSLGVVLYELLCGRPPYDVSSARVFEATRLIREQTPARPSTVDRALRGDLETIVLKALEKDRERRYQSAADLGQDLQRYLSSQPIAARPPSMAYQMRTFARRNKALVGGVAMTFAVLLFALIVVSVLLVRIQRQADRRAEMNQFLESLLITADSAPYIAGGNQPPQFGANAKWVDVIDDAVARLDEHPLADQEAEAAIRHRVGMIYLWMWRIDQAHANLQKAAAVRQQLWGDDNPDTLDSLAGLAWSKIFLFQHEQAQQLAQNVVARCTRLYGPADRRTFNAMHLLAICSMRLGYRSDFDVTAREMFDIVNTHPEAGLPRSVPKALMAESFRSRGMLNQAEVMARESVAEAEVDSQNSLAHAWAIMQLAWLAQDREDLATAEDLMRRAVGMWDARSGRIVEFQTALVKILCAQPEKVKEGLALARGTLKSLREQYGDAHPYTSDIAFQLSFPLVNAGKPDEAEAALRLCLLNTDLSGHVWVPQDALVLVHLGKNLQRQGRLEEAEAMIRRADEVAEQVASDQWQRVELGGSAWFRAELAAFLEQLGRHGEAEPLWNQAREEVLHHMTRASASNFLWLRQNFAHATEADELLARTLVESLRSSPYPSTLLADAFNKHAVILSALGRNDEALICLRERLDVLRQLFDPSHRRVLVAMNALAWHLVILGRPAEAEPIAREAVEVYRQSGKPASASALYAQDTWAVALRGVERLDEAERAFRELDSLWRSTHADGKSLPPDMQMHFGDCLLAMKRFEEAEPLLRESHAVFSKEAPDAPDLKQTTTLLIRLYEQWGKPEQAQAFLPVTDGSNDQRAERSP